MSSPVFPTRHGDWHEINGQLVDLSQAAAEIPDSLKAVTGSDVDGAPVRPGEARRAFGSGASQWLASAASSPISLPPSSPKRRNKTSSED